MSMESARDDRRDRVVEIEIARADELVELARRSAALVSGPVAMMVGPVGNRGDLLAHDLDQRMRVESRR